MQFDLDRQITLILPNLIFCRLHKHTCISIGLVGKYGSILTEIDDRAAESAEQDQTARMCSLILLDTLRKIYPRSHTADKN